MLKTATSIELYHPRLMSPKIPMSQKCNYQNYSLKLTIHKKINPRENTSHTLAFSKFDSKSSIHNDTSVAYEQHLNKPTIPNHSSLPGKKLFSYHPQKLKCPKFNNQNSLFPLPPEHEHQTTRITNLNSTRPMSQKFSHQKTAVSKFQSSNHVSRAKLLKNFCLKNLVPIRLNKSDHRRAIFQNFYS